MSKRVHSGLKSTFVILQLFVISTIGLASAFPARTLAQAVCIAPCPSPLVPPLPATACPTILTTYGHTSYEVREGRVLDDGGNDAIFRGRQASVAIDET